MSAHQPLLRKSNDLGMNSMSFEQRRKKSKMGVWILGILGIMVSISFGIPLPSLQFFITQPTDADPPGVCLKCTTKFKTFLDLFLKILTNLSPNFNSRD